MELDSASIGMLVTLVVLVAMSAYFSATETAFTSLNRIRLRTKADNGSLRAAKTLELAEEYDKLLSTILIGNNIVNITATTVATVLCTKWFRQYGPTVSTVALTVIILIFGEITPKSLAKEMPERCAMFAYPLLKLLMVVLTPMNFLFTQWKRLLGRVFRSGGDDGITEEELVGMVDQAETEGGLDEHESDLIRNAIEFNDLEVSEILTPRVDLVAAEEDSTMEEVAALFAESGYSRIPIYHETIDNIVGVVHEKDFYAARYRGETMVSNIKAPVFYTTGNTKISELLRILQKNKAHMAVVVDEYGGTEGIATLEDIVEELVGEIWDEHDEVIENFQKQPDGSYLIACSADLDDMYDLFQVKGTCDAATVSGWVMEQVGRVPEVGDHFQAEGLDVTVTKVEHRRVLEIKVRVMEEESK
ncbi:HlyC/CorC family transporter [Pseudoflavonifractor phocaeensis]|uniref:HlyC/CorC family transporter n=1 Tax=Pseudoflavonifractor phocaeensis TaxID=1870988 RepID=UPI001F2D194B|nr:hemolysin family protein [Pseudoflavonifractor phocaeensis]MCF2596371.1 HlyC/CorC family transporter [Pseudoflavonifractor phocaeensis]MDY3906383.1 hemolysin family protein [Lawsonibacter sp.]